MNLTTVVSAGIAVAGVGVVLALGRPAARARGGGPPADATIEWTAYGGDAGGTRYSRAAQITRENVKSLTLAWTYRTGDWAVGPGQTRFEATPLLVDGTLYVATPFGRVIALDPATGRERWAFDGHADLSGHYGDFATRGVATWRDPRRATDAPCARRIYIATIDARLIAIDAARGAPCADFGSAGEIDLKTDLVNPPFELGEYEVTSPPAVLGDLVIVGSAIADNNRADTPSGVVRAYDARTGRRRWAWDPIPRRGGDPAYDTWRGPSAHRTGAANAWTVISVDSARKLVFVPTGSASPDFYGGERLGENRYANSLVALRGTTGEVVWAFQAVHHDLWDYDLPAQPALVTLQRDGRAVPAVVQASKMGYVFVLDRETGRPLFPVEERPVPASDVPGEEAWPTQPVPVRPRPLVPTRLRADEVWGATPQDRDACRAAVAGARNEGIFTPPSLAGTVVVPGFIGGGNWSGVSIDPARGLAIVPVNRLPFLVRLVPRALFDSVRRASPGWQGTPQRGTPYGMLRRALLSPGGLPCVAPPWGTMVAIDLASGEVQWEVPQGAFSSEAEASSPSPQGAINLGGALVTGGGLVFAAGSPDRTLRAYDVATGAELWKTTLPAAGVALPMTYQLADGRQFVVIAAGGREPLWKQGDWVVAFALPGRDSAAGPQVYEAYGTWRGELVVERTRWPASLELTLEHGVPGGTLTLAGGRITGTVSGATFGNRVTYRVRFTDAERHCSGDLQGIADIANRGRLFVGEVRISGGCSGEAPEVGTIALRRP